MLKVYISSAFILVHFNKIQNTNLTDCLIKYFHSNIINSESLTYETLDIVVFTYFCVRVCVLGAE